MIPIECPECHSDQWHLLRGPDNHPFRELECFIREDAEPMIQQDFWIVKGICEECKSIFWMEEEQAKCVIEEFM